MKKLLAICLVLVTVVTMCVSAVAAPNGFVSSPSGNSAPTVEDFEASDEDCTARLVITPYAEKEELPQVLLDLFEKAYDTIVDTADLTTLNEDLAKIAADKGIAGANLAVSDLFDIHVTGCDFHDGHVDFDVTLKADTLSHFVGLLHMNKNGEWELVSDAKVSDDGEHLTFSVESFSPFAVVVDTSDMPNTGDNAMVYVYAVIMAASALAFVFVCVKMKKQEN